MLAGIIVGTTVNAAPVATVTALKSPVWLQRDDNISEAGSNSIFNPGDIISTGDNGQVEMQLWTNARLQLNSASTITIQNEIAATNTTGPPRLYINQGRACIDYTSQSSSENKFEVNIGDMMFAAIQSSGDICIFRGDGLSSVKLRAGSVQVTHAADPSIIILSETGMEIHITDGGSYDLRVTGEGDSTGPEIEMPFVVGTVNEKSLSGRSTDSAAIHEPTPAQTEVVVEQAGTDIAGNADSSAGSATEDSGTSKRDSKVVAPEALSAYVYTVYLFSTGSFEIADQVNRKFQQAGYDTQIYQRGIGSESRYRIAVPGFESRRAAETFADSMVGKLGISDTWIGRELR